MAVKPYGHIMARNVKTGRCMEIREDMLHVPGNHWEVVDPNYKPTEAKRAKVKEPEVRVIMTSENKPFKTEASARSAMKTKGLDENQWIVLPNGNDGFIISKL